MIQRMCRNLFRDRLKSAACRHHQLIKCSRCPRATAMVDGWLVGWLIWKTSFSATVVLKIQTKYSGAHLFWTQYL